MVDGDALKRAEQKRKAALRAEFSLKTKFDRIDYELDVVAPTIKALKESAAQGLLVESTLVEEGDDEGTDDNS